MLARVAGICLAFVLTTGCALAPRFQEPHLQVIDVQVLRGNLLRQELRVHMQVDNPNNRVLAVRGIEYKVQVAGDTFAHGQSVHDFTVPANGQTQFDVGVTANAAAALLRLLGDGSRDAIDYRITGKVRLSTGLVRSIPFDQKGQLRLR